MRTVFKFVLHISDEPQSITLPVGSQIVLVAPQGDLLCMWVELDTSSSLQEARRFSVHGTGHPIPPRAVFVGSVVMEPFVWHVCEVPR